MNEPPFRQYNRRWYDSINNMTLALLISQKLPTEIRKMVGDNLNRMINDSRKMQKHNPKYAISMGPHQVLGLYKSGRRMRWYDPDPVMHRAFSFMSTVPEQYLIEFAERVIKVGHYVNQQGITFPEFYQERSWLTDTVEGILDESTVSFRDSGEGFRVVGDEILDTPLHPRYMLPKRPRIPKSR